MHDVSSDYQKLILFHDGERDVYIPAGVTTRMSIKLCQKISLEKGMRDSFPRSEEISGFTTTLVQAHLERNIVPLSSCLGVSCEQGLIREDEGV